MKRTLHNCLYIACLAPLLLGGCAVGGGSAARFTPKNAQEIVLTPYYLSDPAEGGNHTWYMKLKIAGKVPVAGFLKPNQMLVESFTNWLAPRQTQPGQPLSPPKETTVGGCSGSYRGTIEAQGRDHFSGRLVFDDYSDDCSLVFTGSVPFGAELDAASGAVEMTLPLGELTARLAEKQLKLKGNLALDFNLLQGEKQLVRAESRMALADESGLRIGLEPVLFTWDRRGRHLISAYEGQLLIPPYGLVQLTTLSPIKIVPGTHKPYNGALRFEGAEGAWIRLLYANPGKAGFFRVDGSDGMESIGYL